MRVSMVMIARDEAANVRPCLSSFWDHVDEVVLCDTGSRDDTVKLARAFAREHGPVRVVRRLRRRPRARALGRDRGRPLPDRSR
jgi:glycosyltransferase involved in cell wall biosynthesis